jgi:hypothetical protein
MNPTGATNPIVSTSLYNFIPLIPLHEFASARAPAIRQWVHAFGYSMLVAAMSDPVLPVLEYIHQILTRYNLPRDFT